VRCTMYEALLPRTQSSRGVRARTPGRRDLVVSTTTREGYSLLWCVVVSRDIRKGKVVVRTYLIACWEDVKLELEVARRAEYQPLGRTQWSGDWDPLHLPHRKHPKPMSISASLDPFLAAPLRQNNGDNRREAGGEVRDTKRCRPALNHRGVSEHALQSGTNWRRPRRLERGVACSGVSGQLRHRGGMRSSCIPRTNGLGSETL